ncbi:inosose dehydratase [Novosphingobium capsulatum]|uniref:Inosose dehydratase n=1 Tax=Novosphingobium capsulatum TaxID=13688 RepID=A0ABU1MLD3_9SPHN|nr:myo-inosose-2 dehydratase [Novosphingobium capsulatum]MDR6511136.1 inosose dehydratase [Novosphingobium capsulatum]
MTVRWGVSPIGWVNDDLPSLGAGTTLDTILSDAAAIGFAGIERGGIFPAEPAVLAATLDQAGLALAGAWHGSGLLAHGLAGESAAIEAQAKLLAACGCDVFILAETSGAVHGQRDTPLRQRPRLAPSEWPAFGAMLDSVAARLADRGLRLAYHYHLGTVVEDAQDLARLIDATGEGVGLVIDTGHARLGGIDVPALIREHPARVVHVHAKDVRPAVAAETIGQGASFLDGVIAGMFTVPGDGAVDFAAVCAALAAIDYAGWIVIEAEQDPALAPPAAYARAGLAHLRALWMSAGPAAGAGAQGLK